MQEYIFFLFFVFFWWYWHWPPVGMTSSAVCRDKQALWFFLPKVLSILQFPPSLPSLSSHLSCCIPRIIVSKALFTRSTKSPFTLAKTKPKKPWVFRCTIYTAKQPITFWVLLQEKCMRPKTGISFWFFRQVVRIRDFLQPPTVVHCEGRTPCEQKTWIKPARSKRAFTLGPPPPKKCESFKNRWTLQKGAFTLLTDILILPFTLARKFAEV